MKSTKQIVMPKAILFILLSFYIVVFCGVDLNWVGYIYDQWRIVGVIILFIISAYGVFCVWFDQLEFGRLFSSSQNGRIIFFLFLSFICGLIFIPHYQYSKLALVDFSLYILFLLSGVGLYFVFIRLIHSSSNFLNKFILIFSLIPVFIVLLFVVSLFLFYREGLFFDWKPQFPNRRPYDSIMIVFIMVLWYVSCFFRKYIFLIGFISVMYVSTLLFDGARSSLLSILISLIIVLFTHNKSRRYLYLPAMSIIFSIFFYTFNKVTMIFFYTDKSYLLFRSSSSGRLDLWKYALEKWIENPLTGVGGGSFNYNVDVYRVMSPHNVMIQLISEWGLAGFTFLFFICSIVFFIYKNRESIHPLLYAVIIAVCLDANFTGALIHPIQMLTILCIFSFVLANIPKKYHYDSVALNGIFKKWCLSAFVFAVLSIVFVHGSDFICMGCVSVDEFHAPRFWEYGRALHLQPMNEDSN